MSRSDRAAAIAKLAAGRPSRDDTCGAAFRGVAPFRPAVRKRTLPRLWRATARNASGFTLIELLVVLVILALLAGLVGPQLFGKIDVSKAKTAQTQVKMLYGALQSFRLDVGRYPTTEEGLDALVRPPPDAAGIWNGPYLDGEVPNDPWRTPYRYASPASNLQGIALYSLGADSKAGGEGIDGDVGYLPARPK